MSTTTTKSKHRSFAVVGPELPRWPPGPPTVPIHAHDPAVKPTRYAVADPTGSLRSTNECRIFASLYAEHREFVYRTVERHGVPMRDADDITQEVFSIALARIQDFDAARAARPWLFVIAIQRTANYRRLARNRVEPVSPVTPPEPAAETVDVESAMLVSEERTIVRELIGRLSPKLRSILIMHDLEERSMEDIITELKIPLKTAQARLKLARDEVLRRGHAVVLSQNAIPLRNRDLLRVREEILAYRKTPPKAEATRVKPQRQSPSAPLTYLVFA